MKQVFSILILFLGIQINGSSQLKIFAEQKPGGGIIYAKNTDLFPYSIVLELDFTNMSFSEGKINTFVIPPGSEKFKIGELTALPGKKYKYGYKYRSNMGDYTKKPDPDYKYDLPFSSKTGYKLFQGYNGSFSHKNENSLDFTMPIGTEVLAAREGVVVQVVQNFSINCLEEDCKKYNNYVTVMHDDGSFARYVHIKHNGSLVKIGDVIKKGDKIALSGNVGYSNGPHLHFVCFGADEKGRVTYPTKFRVNDGNTAIFLEEGKTYKCDY